MPNLVAPFDRSTVKNQIHFPLIQIQNRIYVTKVCLDIILKGLKNNSSLDLSPAIELQVYPITKVKIITQKASDDSAKNVGGAIRF